MTKKHLFVIQTFRSIWFPSIYFALWTHTRVHCKLYYSRLHCSISTKYLYRNNNTFVTCRLILVYYLLLLVFFFCVCAENLHTIHDLSVVNYTQKHTNIQQKLCLSPFTTYAIKYINILKYIHLKCFGFFFVTLLPHAFCDLRLNGVSVCVLVCKNVQNKCLSRLIDCLCFW